MLPIEVIVAYVSMNVIFAILIMFKSPRNTLSRFYAVGVASLVYLGVLGFFLSQPLPSSLAKIFENLALFQFAIFPFLFIHFIIIFIRDYGIMQSPWVIVLNYAIGVLCFILLLAGLIPAPLFSEEGITPYGYTFFLTWQSIYFCVGIALMHSVIGGFSDRHIKVNLLIKGFALLLLLLPGPFTTTLFLSIIPRRTEWFFYSSLASLVVAIYLIFRHKIIVNTPYEKLKETIAIMNDVLIKTDETFHIELVRGASATLLGYEERNLIGYSLVDLVGEKYLFESYRDFVFRGKMKESFFDAEVITKNGTRLPMFFSMSPVRAGNEVTGFVALGRSILERRQLEEQLRLERDSLELRVKERTEELKNLNETLRESEQRSRILYELTHDYAHQDRVEPDGRLVVEWMSEGAARLSGYSLEESYAPDFWQRLIYPDDFPIFLEHSKRVLSGQADTVEGRIVTKSGEVLWLEETARPIWDAAQGRVVRIYGGARDITDRKRAEEVIRHANERFGAFTEITIEGLVFHDKGVILDVNPALSRMFGYQSESEIIGRNLLEFLPPHVHDDVMKRIVSGDTRPYESLGVRKDGSIFPVEAHADTYDYNGRIIRIASIRDLTEREKIKETLKRSEEMYRSVVERANDGICILQDGIVKFVNTRLARYRGESVELMLGNPFTGYIDPDELSKVAEYYRRRMAGELAPQYTKPSSYGRTEQRCPLKSPRACSCSKGNQPILLLYATSASAKRRINSRKRSMKLLKQQRGRRI